MAKGGDGESLEAMFHELREMLSGAALRAIAGIKDVGEILVATVGDSTSDTHQVHEKRKDVWVRFTDVLSGITGSGRLYAPAGILWRLTQKGQGAHVIHGRKMRGAGGPLVIPDGGDGDTENVVPQWLSTSLSGISLPEGFEIESTGDQVIIKSNSGGTSASVVLNKDGSVVITPAAGKTVRIAGNTYSLPKLETLLADFATNWNLLIGVLNAGTQGTPVAQTLTGLAAVLAQLTQFGTDLAGATYKSTVAKNG